DDFLPDLRIRTDAARFGRVNHKPGGLQPGVVARHSILGKNRGGCLGLQRARDPHQDTEKAAKYTPTGHGAFLYYWPGEETMKNLALFLIMATSPYGVDLRLVQAVKNNDA